MSSGPFQLRIGAERVALPAGDFTLVLGRSVDAQIRIPDSVASRRHARLVSMGGVFAVEDLGSRSGTLVNGAKAEGATVLSPGDTIRIGNTDVVFDGGSQDAGRKDAGPRGASPKVASPRVASHKGAGPEGGGSRDGVRKEPNRAEGGGNSTTVSASLDAKEKALRDEDDDDLWY